MRRRGECGQSTVEFALIIPLVLVATLLLIQVAVVAHAQLSVSHLARETARAVAADRTVDVGRLTQERSTLGTQEVVIEVLFEPSISSQRDFVVVTVSYQVPSVSRVFSPFMAHFQVSSQVKMLLES